MGGGTFGQRLEIPGAVHLEGAGDDIFIQPEDAPTEGIIASDGLPSKAGGFEFGDDVMTVFRHTGIL
jgi:hypothetical protein